MVALPPNWILEAIAILCLGVSGLSDYLVYIVVIDDILTISILGAQLLTKPNSESINIQTDIRLGQLGINARVLAHPGHLVLQEQ